ncbi:MAG: hypothetical protein RL098_1818, partial [Bacteroidota bacterium]
MKNRLLQFIFVLFCLPVFAQNPFTPQQFLGYNIGEQ